jgi:hypothetical protein
MGDYTQDEWNLYVPTANEAGASWGDKVAANFPKTAAGLTALKSSIAALASKAPVRAVTTTNVTLSGLQTVDTSVVLVDGDSVLVAGQTNGVQNGIYLAHTGAWVRRTDADGANELVGGTTVWVQEGTINADSYWELKTDGVITPGTTAQVWAVAAGPPAQAADSSKINGVAVSGTPSVGQVLTATSSAAASWASSTGGGGTLGTWTTTKTADYTASVNERIPCDATSGSFKITVPTATTGQQFAVFLDASSGTNSVAVWDGTTTFTTVASIGHGVVMEKTSTSWRVLTDRKTQGSLDGRYRRVLSSSDPRWAFPTDGTTACDSQMALMRAAAVALGGAELYLDPIAATTYKFTNSFTLPDNCTLSSTTAVSFSSSNSLVITLGSFSEIRDLHLVSTYSAGTGVLVNIGTGAHNSAIKGCWLDSPNAHCIQANALGIHDIVIRDNRFMNSSYGILLNQGSPDIYNVKIINNNFESGIKADAIELNWPSSAWGGASGGRNVVIQGNHISTSLTSGSSNGSGFGIGIAGGQQINIVGNTIESTRNQAIHIEDNSAYINISGNTINNVGHGLILSGCSGITVASASSCVTIIGNTINNCAETGIFTIYTTTTFSKTTIIANNIITNNGFRGINVSADYVTGGTTVPVQNVIITGNIVGNSVGDGITTSGAASGCRIEGNIVEANGGYGINIGTPHKLATIVRGNICENNTLGETNFNYATGALAASNDFFKSINAPLTSNTTGPISLFLCGRSAVGTLLVYAQYGIRKGTVAYRINWDGNKLRASQIASDLTSAITISQPFMAGNMLQVSANDSNGTDPYLTMSLEFYGTVINDNAVGAGTPLVVDDPAVVRGSATPTTGTWAAGDVLWNTGSSGPPAWRATANGIGASANWQAVGAKRTQTLTNAASVTFNVDSFDGGVLTALSQTTNFVNPTGTPVNGQQYLLRVKSTSSQSLTWDTQFRGGSDTALPSATTGSTKTDYYGFSWNAADSKWDIIAVTKGY